MPKGEKRSVLALTDGEQSLLLPPSQDHKRIGEGDTGLNTGGMGAYSPVSTANRELLGRVRDEILSPVLAGLAETGAPYKGVLYAGLMIAPSGDLNVLEFNCRFGDPEAQVVLPVLDFDILEHMWQIAAGETWRPVDSLAEASGAAVTTVLASRGYPHRLKRAWRYRFRLTCLQIRSYSTLELRGTKRACSARRAAACCVQRDWVPMFRQRFAGAENSPRWSSSRVRSSAGISPGAKWLVPELPEVETIVRDLATRLNGRTLRNPRLFKFNGLREVTARKLLGALRDTTVQEVYRRAKHAVFLLDSGLRRVIQPRMTGVLMISTGKATAEERRYRVLKADFGDDVRFVYRDVRRLGTIWLLDETAWRTYTGRIGQTTR